MAREVQLDTKELVQLAADIGKSPVRVRSELRMALTKSINTIHARATERAPYDTGDLQESIKKTSGQTQSLNRRVWTDLKQGFFQEFGTSRHPPQPWITPALEAESPHFERAVSEIIGKPL